MKANTIEQFFILKFIKENFYMDNVAVTLIDPCNVKIEDANGDAAIVTYKSKDNIILEVLK